MKYKVMSVSGEQNFQKLLDDMSAQGWRFVTFDVRGHIYDFVAVFLKIKNRKNYYIFFCE